MSTLMAAWKRRYSAMKASSLGALAEVVPPDYRSHFVSYGGASDVQHILASLVPHGAKRILIVGVYGGRDYFFLKSLAKYDVHAMDLTALRGFDQLRVGNVEVHVPFEDGFFDVIVLSEVLEHLVEDAAALRNLRAVLKNDGVMVVSVPFLHDRESTHVRVHTPASIRRLIGCCGLEIIAAVERPGLGFYIPGVNALNHFASLFLHLLVGRTIYRSTLPYFGRIEDWAGRRRNPLRRLSSRWGVHLACRKSGQETDHVGQNAQRFCTEAAETY